MGRRHQTRELLEMRGDHRHQAMMISFENFPHSLSPSVVSSSCIRGRHHVSTEDDSGGWRCPGCHLIIVLSPGQDVTPPRLNTILRNTALYADTGPCLSSHWSESENGGLSLVGDLHPFSTGQQEMSQAAYNNDRLANLINNAFKKNVFGL